ncbi:MAG: NAD(P)-binding domain-containing protein [Silvibacterium sp.]
MRHAEEGVDMSKVGFLGLGAMGSRMAANLLKAGHTVTMWNRSPAAEEALVASVARKASSPKEAADGADFVVAIVRDDEASKNVWLDSTEGALAGMHPGAVAIESSTLTPEWIRELSEHLRGMCCNFQNCWLVT